MIRATQNALCSLNDGSADRIAVAAQDCAASLETGVRVLQDSADVPMEAEERKEIQAVFVRLQELTKICLQEAMQAQSQIAGEQRRVGNVRHFLDAARSATEPTASDFDQEG